VLNGKKGFTLIELLVVVAIVGIISAIAIPNLIIAIERSRQKRTMVDIRNIATAWEARSVETGRYNAAGVAGADQPVNLDNLGTALAPTYIKTFRRADGWGRDFYVFTDQAWGAAATAQIYVIVSSGRDRTEAATEVPGAFTSFDCDIVYSNGSFLSYPEGVQTH
jgi:type IV pilus assembly protein PilA